MNIAFDSTAILGPYSKNRGIGNYSLSQFVTMINLDKENKYFYINFFEDTKLTNYIEDPSNFEEYYFYCGKGNFLIGNHEYKEIIGDVIKNFIKDNEIDIFYITSPFDGHVHTYEKSWFEGIKTVATVYDIIPYIFKDKYLSSKNSYKWYMNCVNMLKWVDKLLVISQSVKDDLINYLGFDEKNITVINGAVSNHYKKIVIDESTKESLFSRYGINDNYIMCTGGDDGRKNIEGLIAAYSKLDISLINEYQLVIVCKLSDDSVNKYTRLINNNKVSGRVILTNFVNDDDLLALYNLAYLLAFPSKYEGFGLPVVEAYACGIPVLTSNNSSLGEIANGAAILVNPFDIKDITRGLTEALINADLNDLVKKGYKKLELYNWETVAKLAINEINKFENKNCKKNKIAFFTSLTPIESKPEAFNDTIFTLNELSGYFEIDLYTNDNCTHLSELNTNIHAYNHKDFENNSIKYFDIIYQIRNCENDFYMLNFLKRYKGILILHDILDASNFYTYTSKIIVHDNEIKKNLLSMDIHNNVLYINSNSSKPISKKDIKRYVEFINETKAPSLNEQQLKNISNEIKEIYNDSELLELVKTLGYSKNYNKDLFNE